MQMTKLITPREAAAALSIGKTKVHEEIGSGRLRSVVIGTKGRRIPVEALDEYVAALATKA